MNTDQAFKTAGEQTAEIKSSLTQRLDQLPWGRFHTVVTTALAIGWLLAAFQTTIIANVLGQVSRIWTLSATQGSWLISAWVVGTIIGAMVFGYLSDLKGRKKMFVFSLLWYASFSLVAACSWNFGALLVFRFLTALAIGGEYTAVMAAMVEFIPSKHRGKVSALILASYPLGGVLSSLTTMYCLNHLSANVGWRIGFGLGGLLAILGLWVRFAIPESPRWLLTHGFVEKAEEIVCKAENSIAGLAGRAGFAAAQPAAPLSPGKGGVHQPSFLASLKELFSTYLGRVSMACSLNFAQASVNYGLMSLLGLVILPAVNVPAERTPFFYLMGNVGALGGSLLAAFLLDSWGRKGTLLLGFSVTTVEVFQLYFARTPTAVLVAYSLLLFGLIWSSNSAYIAISEILPDRNRSTGLGISVATGRVGAFISPILLSSLYVSTQNARLALLGLAVMSLPGPIGALAWCLRGTEAKNRSLEEMCRQPER